MTASGTIVRTSSSPSARAIADTGGIVKAEVDGLAVAYEDVVAWLLGVCSVPDVAGGLVVGAGARAVDVHAVASTPIAIVTASRRRTPVLVRMPFNRGRRACRATP